jgi:hypothetical protein
MFARQLVCLLVLPLGVATLSSCGSDDESAPAAAPESYRGLVSTDRELAIVELTIASSVTGTLTYDGRSIALTGSVSGRTATATAEGWTLTVTTDGSDRTRFTGNYQTPLGYTGTFSAMKVRTGSTITFYCGGYTATSMPPTSGPMGLALDGTVAGGVFATATSAGELTGEVQPPIVGFTGYPPAGPGKGDISGNTIKGTWSFGGAYGDFDIATDRCPRVSP